MSINSIYAPESKYGYRIILILNQIDDKICCHEHDGIGLTMMDSVFSAVKITNKMIGYY